MKRKSITKIEALGEGVCHPEQVLFIRNEKFEGFSELIEFDQIFALSLSLPHLSFIYCRSAHWAHQAEGT